MPSTKQMEESQKLRKETSSAELQRSADPDFDIFFLKLGTCWWFRNPAPPGMLRKPCKKTGWTTKLNWCRISSINSRMRADWQHSGGSGLIWQIFFCASYGWCFKTVSPTYQMMNSKLSVSARWAVRARVTSFIGVTDDFTPCVPCGF